MSRVAEPERALSARELNRALLARQLLLERSPLSIPEALEQVAGLQMQYAPSGYIGLRARLAGFRRESLTEALEARHVVQATLMRSTIHLVSAADFWPFAIGTARARREWWLRVERGAAEGLDVDAASARVLGLVRGRPRRQADVLALLAAEGLPRLAWVGPAHFLPLVRIPPSGTWERRRADVYGLAEEWLGPPVGTEDDGLALLARRYLGGFGPAPLADIASWAGVPVSMLGPVVAGLELRRFRTESGAELLDLPGAPLPDPDTPAPVRFLPTWDATLLVHARRTGILPEPYRPLVFHTRTPHSVPTFLVDGAVAGTWRFADGRVELRPFAALSPDVLRELESEAAALAAFHGDGFAR